MWFIPYEVHKISLILFGNYIDHKKEGKLMEIKKIRDLLIRGFDIEFNVGDVFYSFTKVEINNETRYYIGSKNYAEHSFLNVEEMLTYQINGISLSEIIKSTNEDEISY